jgi:hypothetical protein
LPQKGQVLSSTEHDSHTAKLSRRDYFLLPLLCLSTIVFMFIVAEAGARTFWKSQQEDPCRLNDPLLRFKYRPNCKAHLKIFEGPWVDYDYNDCGFRSRESCRAKPANGVRIAVLGSSFAEGYMVPYEQTFGGLLERNLSRSCSRPVQVQNLSAVAITTMDVYHRMDEALALHPDMVILTLAPHDLEYLNSEQDMAERDHPAPIAFDDPAKQRISPLATIKAVVKNSRTSEVAEHFLFDDPATYVRLYLLYGDNADFLRQPFTPLWNKRFDQFDVLIGEMADRLHARGIPLVWVAGVQRAQAQLLSTKNLPPRVDPFAFEEKTAEIARKHGAIVITVDQAFQQAANAGKLFYPVDGHLTAPGQQLFGRAIEQQLVEKGIASLGQCERGQNSAAMTAVH